MAMISSRLRARQPLPTPPVRARRALVAAASSIPLDGAGWKNFKLGDTAWQTEGWHHYDICGELRFVSNWIGSAVSRCRLYVAEIDETGKPGKEVTDPAVAVLAETLFGGPANKAEALRLIGTHLYVPGESFIVAEGVEKADEDRWYVVSTSGIKRQGTTDIQVQRPQEYGGGWFTLAEGRDLLIRVWTPHPRQYDQADSSVRPALPILREVEQLTKHVFAQIDSRLAGAGLLLLPDQLDFPRGEDDPDGTQGLMKVLERAMAAALSDRSDPSSLVPIMAQVPGEFIDKVRHITFETPLAKEGMEIRDRALRRLALSLDVDPEILLGKGDTNHWSAWQVEESTIKVHIEPLLVRLCDALTTGYLRAALTLIGKDPEQFTFWYDTSPLAVRPNRQADGLQLHEAGAISDQALRTSGAWSEDDKPDDAETLRRLVEKLVLAQPDLIREPAIQAALGVTLALEAAPAAPPAGELPPEEPEEEVPARRPTEDRALPERADKPTAAQAALIMGAHMVVQRSLEMAGKRLLTRANRDKFHQAAPHDLHTHIHVLDPDHADRLLADTFASVPMLAERTGVNAGTLRGLLATYCRELMVRAHPHDIELLETYLDAGLRAADGAQFHLPGRHDQSNHGRRKSKPDFTPFTPKQRAERAAERARSVDPDRDASAPARQGRRQMQVWEVEARHLTAKQARDVGQIAHEIVEEPKKGKSQADREEEWKKRELRLRYEIELKVDQNREWMEDRGYSISPEMRAEWRKRSEEAVERARVRFMAGDNPDELSFDSSGGVQWFAALVKDTPWDAPVPVRDLPVQSTVVAHGYAFRRDGITYVVETSGPGASTVHAQAVAKAMQAAHETLPGTPGKFQSGYAWLNQPSPHDAYWQQRFNNPNHTAYASAGDGSVAIWSRKPFEMPDAYTANTIQHEYGHNVDQVTTMGGRLSSSEEYQRAAEEDFRGNRLANRQIVDFNETVYSGGHTVKFTEGHGREAPYGPTNYGQSSWSEDLAESTRLYLAGVLGTGTLRRTGEVTHVYFRDLFPARAAILDREFPELARAQKEQIKRERARLRRVGS